MPNTSGNDPFLAVLAFIFEVQSSPNYSENDINYMLAAGQATLGEPEEQLCRHACHVLTWAEVFMADEAIGDLIVESRESTPEDIARLSNPSQPSTDQA
jgi:hypothetical protein